MYFTCLSEFHVSVGWLTETEAVPSCVSAYRADSEQQHRTKWQNLSACWSFTPGSSVTKWKPVWWWPSSWVAEKTLRNGAERAECAHLCVQHLPSLSENWYLWCPRAASSVELCVVNTSPASLFYFICPPNPSHFPCVVVVSISMAWHFLCNTYLLFLFMTKEMELIE